MDCGLRRPGLGIKHRVRYKTRTTDYGLGIKYGPRYKTLSAVYGLGIKHGLGYTKENERGMNKMPICPPSERCV